jgi:O-antigen/teichoic acid export membrane protein
MISKIKKLQLSNEALKYFHNTSWMFLDKALKMAVGFFVIVYLTRYLGPDRFGMLSYAESVVSIFLALSTLGLANGGPLVRELVNSPVKRDMLLGTVFYLTLFSSIITISIILGVVNFLPDGQVNILILIISFSIIFQNINMIIIDYFQYKVLFKYVAYCGTTVFFTSSALKITLIYFNMELVFFAYALLFDSAFLLVGLAYIYKKQGLSFIQWEFNLVAAKLFLKVAIPLTLVAISAFVYTRIDQIMIKHMLGNEAVGNYAAAIKVSELFYFIPGIIVTSLFPKLVALKKDKGDYLGLLEKMYRLTMWIAIPIAISIFLFSDLIVSILYGGQYTQASGILAILSWGLIFASVSAVFVKILYVESYEKKYLFKNLFGVVMNIVLNYYLILMYGVYGAAIATIVTLFSVNYIYDLLDKDLRRFYYLKINALNPFKL